MDWVIIGNIAIGAFILVLAIDIISYILQKRNKISNRLYNKIHSYILILDFILIIVFWIATKYKY